MTHTFTTTSDVGPNHRVILELPSEVPIGPVRITVTVESTADGKIRTLGDLITSGVAGMYADRTDLPNTDEEFREWRRKAWAGSDE